MRFARLQHVTMGLGMAATLVACATTGDDADVTKKDDPNGMPGDVARAVANLPEGEVMSANADVLRTFAHEEIAHGCEWTRGRTRWKPRFVSKRADAD